jgi:dTDP-4-dehydrorhamnose reductase
MVLGLDNWDLAGLYHLANCEFFSRDELARQFARACGMQAEIVIRTMEEFRFADPRPIKTYLECSKSMDAISMIMTSMRTVFERFLVKARSQSEPGGESR